MFKRFFGLLLSATFVLPAWADSVTLGTLVDDDHGRSVDLHGRFAPIEALTLGATVGHSRSRLSDSSEESSGKSLGASADLDIDAFFVNAAVDRWKDAGELRSTVLRGELGWMSETGIAVSALVTNRAMRVTYTATALSQTRARNIDFEGTGFGADLTYFGESWTAGARLLDYDYGHSVDRVRAALDSPNTDFPRLQSLIGSVATRAAAAPDRELAFILGRQFARASLNADLQWQRDALTGDKTKSAGLTLGLAPAQHWGIDVSAGLSKGGEAGTVPWVGLTLSLRSAQPLP